MSYSRRQLYAFGEPLGDGATRREVGGKIVYGGGGGGTPEKQTTVVDIPDWAKPYAKESLGKAAALTSTPYQTYGGERIQQFSPLQRQAFTQAGQQQVAGQIGQATGIAGLAAQQALGAGGYQAGNFDPMSVRGPQLTEFQMGPAMGVGSREVSSQNIQSAQTGFDPNLQQYQMAGPGSFTQPGTASQYMSPYMDAVVQQQMESAQRQADIAGTQRGAQAVRAGAFGGSRQAIENAEAARALASQKGQIQAQGLQSSFQQAQQQFNQEQQARQAAEQANLQARLGVQQTGAQIGVQTALANLTNEQQARVQSEANRLQSQGMNQDAAMRAALANQQAGLTVGQQNLAAQLGIQQLGAGQNMQAQLANQQAMADAQRAFEQSRQFGANLGLQGSQAAMQGAQTLGQLGGQQFGQQMDIMGRQADLGGQQRAAGQQILDQQYQDFLNQQRAPYDQLSFMNSIIRGTPMGQTTTQYAPPPSTTSQLIGLGTAAAGAYGASQGRAAGGEVKSYAAGGIASLSQPEIAAAADGMSDQQLQQTQGLPSITELARMTLAAEAQQRAQMRQAAMAQQAMMQQQPQATVAEEQMAALGGISDLPAPNLENLGDGMAGGGIVAFQTGDMVPDPYDNRLRRGPSVMGITDQPPAPLPPPLAEERPPALPAAPDYSGIMGLYGQERDRQFAAQEQLGLMRAADLAADRAALAEEEKRATEFGAEREKRLKGQEEKLAGSEKQNLNMTLIDMGLAMMAGKSPDALQNLAAGAQQGLKGYQGRLQNIQDSREKLDESMARLAEIREEKLSAVGARKRELQSMERRELTNSKEAQEKIYSSFADKKITLSKDQAKAVSDRSLAVWTAQQKGAAGSRTDANNLRLALSTEIKALRNQRDSGNGLSEAETQQLAQLESEFRSLTNILGERLGVQGGGTVAGSSTLPAGFKLD